MLPRINSLLKGRIKRRVHSLLQGRMCRQAALTICLLLLDVKEGEGEKDVVYCRKMKNLSCSRQCTRWVTEVGERVLLRAGKMRWSG